MKARMPARLCSLLREPLVQFLALGVLIFTVDALINPSAPTADRNIEVTGQDLSRIRTAYVQQWGSPPSDAEISALLDTFVRSEILFREGSALGLADGDSVIRNRVIQKMEFLLRDPSAVSEPTEAELVEYLSNHADRFSLPATLRVEQLYFSLSARPESAEADASRALVRLREGSKPTDEGDPLMLPPLSEFQSEQAIAKAYGSSFAQTLFNLDNNDWNGPIRSVTGLHLVRILDRQTERMPALQEIRGQVHDAIMATRMTAQNTAAYERLAANYDVSFSPGVRDGADSAKSAR